MAMRGYGIHKKGMFFTIIAITLLSLMAVSMTIISISHERESTTRRINTLNDYVFSLEEDLPRKLYISGFRIVFIFEKRMLENGSYIGDAQALFEEAFFNGTIDGAASSDEAQLLAGVTYPDIQDDLTASAQKVNLKISLSNPQITLDQADPWNLRSTLQVDLLIEDLGGLVSWNRTAIMEGYIPIKNFEDPLYLIKTNGLITQKVRETPYMNFVSGGNTTNLSLHVTGNYYVATNESPSFLNRLEGNMSADTYGIESLVYPQDLINNGITVLDKTLVDHVYFSTSNPSTKQVSGMPGWFKIDAAHEATYQVENITI